MSTALSVPGSATPARYRPEAQKAGISRITPGRYPAPMNTPGTAVRSPWLVLFTLCLAFFMILVDTTIVNIAVPDLTTSLDATLDELLWIINAYTLVYAVLL